MSANLKKLSKLPTLAITPDFIDSGNDVIRFAKKEGYKVRRMRNSEIRAYLEIEKRDIMPTNTDYYLLTKKGKAWVLVIGE